MEFSNALDHVRNTLSDYALNDERLELLTRFYLRFLEANTKTNLSSIREFEPGLILHLYDSLLYSRAFPEAVHQAISSSDRQAIKLFDLGSGGGFPGIPLHLAFGFETYLVESLAKKSRFHQEVIDELHLEGCHTLCERIELVGSKYEGSADLVTARALDSLPVLIEYAAPILKCGGSLIVSKGQPDDDELQAGERAAAICGFELSDRISSRLPSDYGQRLLLRYEKVREAQIKLPRAVGKAHKRPLA